MIKLIKINLLPYREIREQTQKRKFQMMLIGATAAGIILAIATFFYLDVLTNRQTERNAYLTDQITNLDIELGEIKKLENEKELFLARKQKVEELQQKRFQTASIIDTINVLIPDNTYLTLIEAQDKDTYTLQGKASSDNKIALFMRALPNTGLFEHPELLNITKEDKAQEFKLKLPLIKANTPATNSNTAPQEEQP